MSRHNAAIYIHGNGNGRLQLQKLVLTTFVGLSDHIVVHYIELCGPEPISFEFSADSPLELADVGNFYRDTRASDAMYDQYINLDPTTGRHRQAIGDDTLTVMPTSLTFTEVAPRSNEARYCYSVNVMFQETQKNSKHESWGAWIRVRQHGNTNWNRAASHDMKLDLIASELVVANFYWFVILPSGYRAVEEDFRLEAYPRKLQHADTEAQAVMEYTLPPDFAVYSEWAHYIYRRSILKNRRALTFKVDGQVSVSFRAVDDSYASRLSTASFLSGVALALAANAITSLIFYGIAHGFSDIVSSFLAGLGLITAATTWIGLRSLARH